MTDAHDYIDGELPELLRLLQGTDVRELEVREGDVHVRLHRVPTMTAGESVAEIVETEEPVSIPPVNLEITAPIVGTFYRAATPGAPPLVEEGSYVEDHTVVGIIEALQVLTDVEAGCSGTVVNAMATDGQPVQYGQPLFQVAPGG